jgi:hypothetical protein
MQAYNGSNAQRADEVEKSTIDEIPTLPFEVAVQSAAKPKRRTEPLITGVRNPVEVETAEYPCLPIR